MPVSAGVVTMGLVGRNSVAPTIWNNEAESKHQDFILR